jgi:hypothetical protein
MLKITRSIISGSAVLLMVSDLDFEPGDLDIYSPTSQIETVLAMVEKTLGFKRRRSTALTYDTQTHIKRVYHLEKGQKQMNVMVIRGEDPTIAIFQFHSTVVMNYLTAFGLYCAYPALTLGNRGVANLSAILRNPSSRERILRCFDKYRARGVEIENDVTIFPEFAHHVCHVAAECPLTVRSTSDGKGLYQELFPPLEMEAVFATKNEHLVVWHLGGPMCRKDGQTTYFNDFSFSSQACLITVSTTFSYLGAVVE